MGPGKDAESGAAAGPSAPPAGLSPPQPSVSPSHERAAPPAGPSNAGGGGSSLDDVLYGDPSKLTEPIKTIENKYELLPAFLKVRFKASHIFLGPLDQRLLTCFFTSS
jgi:hypothetical protein